MRLLQLLAIPSCVNKWSTNPTSNPKIRLQSNIQVTILILLILVTAVKRELEVASSYLAYGINVMNFKSVTSTSG